MGGSRRITWLVFIVGVVAVVDVLGWVTWRMMRLEAEQTRTRAETARQEAIGRALWRMDSIVLPILAVESARPYFEYQPFYPANRPFDQMWEPERKDDVLVPSPLLGEPGDFVQLHFERDSEGRLTSPQAPASGPGRDAAVAAGVPELLLSMAEIRLYELGRLDAGDRLVTAGGQVAPRSSEGGADDATLRPGSFLATPAAALELALPDAGARSLRLLEAPDLGAAFRDAAHASEFLERAERESQTVAALTRQVSRPPGEELQVLATTPVEAARAAEPPPAQTAPLQEVDQGYGRQDYMARQQAVANAQNLNEAGRANRGRQYDPRPSTAVPAEARSEELSIGAHVASDPRPQPIVPATETLSPPPRTPADEPARTASAQPSTQPAASPNADTREVLAGNWTHSAATGSEPTSASGLAGPEAGQDIPAGLGIATEPPPAGSAGRAVRDRSFEPAPLDLYSSFGTPLTVDDTDGRLSGTLRLDDASGSLSRAGSGALAPTWRGAATTSGEPALVLVRSVTIGGQTREQGVWIDWPALRRALEASVGDLFPLAEVQPIAGASSRAGAPGAQRLATIPVALIPGPLAAGIVPDLPGFWTPTRWTLLIGWIAVAISVVAIGVVLRKAIDLGERRGRFVSAVTHELRTPLTTFRLYSQMLAGGAIADEAKRARYAQTLDRESQRLSGIVESVLEYARLGRRSAAPTARQRLDARAIIERVTPALTGRAERAGMTLVLPDAGSIPEASVVGDADKIERILLNLVDNSCKYAAEAADRRIVLAVAARDGRFLLSVQDFGPGVPAGEHKRLFHAFHRAKHHEASASPGLGLGLALSRGLAREMGGELRLIAPTASGATFELWLPLS